MSLSIILDGRKVKRITLVDLGDEYSREPKENQEMIYCFDFRGEYGVGFVHVLEDGELVESFNDKYILCIDWIKKVEK